MQTVASCLAVRLERCIEKVYVIVTLDIFVSLSLTRVYPVTAPSQ